MTIISDMQDFNELIYKVGINPTAYSGVVSIVNKFGINQDIDTTKADIWSVGGTKTDRGKANFGNVEIVSSSLNDTQGGTGAHGVRVFGYDSEYNFTSTYVSMNGQTAVTLDTQMIDIYRAYVSSAGSNGYNVGTITIRHATGPVTLGQIPAGFGQTQMSHFIIPRNYTAFFIDGIAGIGGIQGGGGTKLGDLHLEVSLPNGEWRMTNTYGATSDSGEVRFNPIGMAKFPEMYRLKGSCTAETSNTRAHAEYRLIMINNDYIT